MFGATLALKGAYEEQRRAWPWHCVEGCVGCALEAEDIFDRWVRDAIGQEMAAQPAAYFFTNHPEIL